MFVAKSKWLKTITILSIASLMLTGCAGHPKGLDTPRQLTNDEKGRAIEIALNTPEVQKQLETKARYTAEINWLAVIWDDSKWSAYYHVDYQWETDPNLKNIPDSAVYYPYVIINIMKPASWIVATAVDLEKGKVVLLHEYPARKGPIQSGSDSLEIRLAPIQH